MEAELNFDNLDTLPLLADNVGYFISLLDRFGSSTSSVRFLWGFTGTVFMRQLYQAYMHRQMCTPKFFCDLFGMVLKGFCLALFFVFFVELCRAPSRENGWLIVMYYTIFLVQIASAIVGLYLAESRFLVLHSESFCDAYLLHLDRQLPNLVKFWIVNIFLLLAYFVYWGVSYGWDSLEIWTVVFPFLQPFILSSTVLIILADCAMVKLLLTELLVSASQCSLTSQKWWKLKALIVEVNQKSRYITGQVVVMAVVITLLATVFLFLPVTSGKLALHSPGDFIVQYIFLIAREVLALGMLVPGILNINEKSKELTETLSTGYLQSIECLEHLENNGSTHSNAILPNFGPMRGADDSRLMRSILSDVIESNDHKNNDASCSADNNTQRSTGNAAASRTEIEASRLRESDPAVNGLSVGEESIRSDGPIVHKNRSNNNANHKDKDRIATTTSFNVPENHPLDRLLVSTAVIGSPIRYSIPLLGVLDYSTIQFRLVGLLLSIVAGVVKVLVFP